MVWNQWGAAQRVQPLQFEVSTQDPAHDQPAPGPDLAALIDTERRLDRLLAEARTRADQLLAAARHDAARDDAALDAAVAGGERRIADQVAADTRARLDALAAGEVAPAIDHDLDDDAIAAIADHLADLLVDRVLAERSR